MMTWHSPMAFLLFIPLIALLAWRFWRRRKMRPSIVFSGLGELQKIPPSLRARIAWLPLAIKVLAISLAIVALARPQRADTKIKRNVEGIDIVITLDISDSMLIEDMKPENRMVASKQVIKDFIAGRTSDRIGLVVFSGEAYTRVPMTLDYPLLQQSLAEVEPSRTIKMGTAIGVALAAGVGRIKDSTAKSRIIIFLTDGENNSGTIDPETALAIAKGYNIKVYSIGMGKDGDAQLPVYLQDGFGRKIKRYRPIHSAVNDELLGRMATETGGKYWRTTTTADLKKVFTEIDRLEKTKIESNQYTKYAELFPPYLEWAMMLYLLAAFLSRSIFRRGP